MQFSLKCLVSFINLLLPFSPVYLIQKGSRSDTATQTFSACTLICLWCHLLPVSHLWLAACGSTCKGSRLGLQGGLSEAPWFGAGCPDNPCDVDFFAREKHFCSMIELNESDGKHEYEKKNVLYDAFINKIWWLFKNIVSKILCDNKPYF